MWILSPMKKLMHRFVVASAVCLLVAAATSVALAFYARPRRAAPGATALVLLILAVAVWSLGYALELGLPQLPTKIFWAKIQYLGIVAS